MGLQICSAPVFVCVPDALKDLSIKVSPASCHVTAALAEPLHCSRVLAALRSQCFFYVNPSDTGAVLWHSPHFPPPHLKAAALALGRLPQLAAPPFHTSGHFSTASIDLLTLSRPWASSFTRGSWGGGGWGGVEKKINIFVNLLRYQTERQGQFMTNYETMTDAASDCAVGQK